MKAAERQLRIRQMLESKDFLDLETLSRELDASESSVRRDLDALEEQSVLKRVYGGAVPVQPPGNTLFDFTVESGRLSNEKSRIGRLAAGLIQDGQTVILDGGSTVAAVPLRYSTMHFPQSLSTALISPERPIPGQSRLPLASEKPAKTLRFRSSMMC